MLRTALVAVVAACALALSACAGLPTSGPVFAGLPPGAVSPPDFSYVPVKPQDGASPEQIVQGFIDAGIGPEGNWAIAQLYLAPDYRDQWKPREITTIDDRTARSYVKSGDGKVVLTVTQQATVDADGVYKTSEGGQTPLAFQLEKVDDQWRISQAPDGIVLGTDQFTSVFHQYPLMYFDPSWQYLVPDMRWFPASNAATRIATALVNGKPSSWLAGSVKSAFPDDVSIDPPAVPVTGSIAEVSLTRPVLSLKSQTLDRMQTQLVRSMAAAGLSGVTMEYNGSALSAQEVATRSSRIDSRALVQTDKGFGFVAGADEVEAVAGITESMTKIRPASIELAADYSAAAVRTESGAVARVPASGDLLSLDERQGLINPVIDRAGFIWSVPESDPGGLVAFDPAGKRAEVNGAWTNASRVGAMAISRDGTRLAALVTVGGQPTIEVSGVVRDDDGVPTSLGDSVTLAKLPGRGIALTWIDDSTLGVLAQSGSGRVVVQQIVGGPASSISAPDDVVAIAGTTATTVRLLGADGTLYSERGSNWEKAGTGVRVLAQAQGIPPSTQG
ncbi:LpqB family beta-propeller domain-containing protein [Microbacterium protaetiae]|nr:LpqB family beta-propeller domain-containing protein [Microbacterium protaetiae]